MLISDVMCLKQADIFNPEGSIKQNAFIHEANSIINSNKKLKVIAYNGSGRIPTL